MSIQQRNKARQKAAGGREGGEEVENGERARGIEKLLYEQVPLLIKKLDVCDGAECLKIVEAILLIYGTVNTGENFFRES